ncbi:Potassium channel [Coniothyrium glycines]
MTSIGNPETPPTSETAVDKNGAQATKPNGRTERRRNVWKRWKEGEESDWWIASTGIPLVAATLGPLANISSIAALVTSWRQRNYVDGQWLSDSDGITYADPRWCYWINVASLICGFLGNLFLLLNFTQRIRYIVALPASIIFWYLASGFLIGITIAMHVYAPPNRPEEVYTQGYWYAVAAASLYTICSMILMVNMLGYFLGHYSQNFALSDSQRTLILQTMSFFIWLGGGAGVFAKIETDSGNDGWSFPDALYFCDVTILTVGFGDLVPTSDFSRGLVFPYSVGGTIILALIVSSLYKAVRELGREKVVQKHQQRLRERALKQTVNSSFDLRHRELEAHRLLRRRTLGYPRISSPIDPRPLRTPVVDMQQTSALPRMAQRLRPNKKPKLLLLREGKDRFEAMRRIQEDSKKYKQWMALVWSVTIFLMLWCFGAVAFWRTEQDTLDITYFQALYFCYVSLLTIGYGDLAPRSNAGRVFFVIWSLIAVPSMTILVSDLGDTVVAKFKKWSDALADFTVLPKKGLWHSFLSRYPWLYRSIQRRVENHKARKRLKRGFETTDPREHNSRTPLDLANGDVENQDPTTAEEDTAQHPTMEALATEAERDSERRPDHASLSRQLALSIQKVSADIRKSTKRYEYEEWVEFTRLIRLTTPERLDRVIGEETVDDDNDEGLVNWDWIGEDSPMVSRVPESQWLLERLCESLVRLEKRKEIARARTDIAALRQMEARAGDEMALMSAAG